jgi:polysaccharide deacetylase family protein (PEP-CTERM system associated)
MTGTTSLRPGGNQSPTAGDSSRDVGTGIVHALSFDIEDWFHLVGIPAVEDPARWPELSARSSLVERYTDLILRLCDDHDTKATFFILGWIAEHHPGLVRRIADAGHEVGTHSFWHRKVYELTPEVFSKDIADSIAAINAGAGRSMPIRGFRAPSFSITPGTEWAFDVLMEHGITYDASLFPATRGHGGYACRSGPHVITTPKGRTLPELPMSIAPVGLFGPLKKRMCYSGGGYMRLLPSFMIDRGVQTELAAKRPTVVYLHPRDFAPDAPRPPMPWHRTFKSYVGTRTTQGKLRRLLTNYRWNTCQHVLEIATGRSLETQMV